jgi:hypothetical protein
VTPGMIGAQLRPHGAAAAIARILKQGYALSFTAPVRGRIVVQWLATTGVKAKSVVVAKGALSLATAGKGKVKMKLTPAGRKLLGHTKKVTLTAKATFTPNNGAPAATATRLFVLKR